MRKKWKLDKLICKCVDVKMCKFICTSAHLLICIFIISCNNSNQSKHIESNQKVELDGLSQPSNQTVFSDVKIISPIHKSIKHKINAIGLISYDPSSLNTISARFSGRIEKLYVRFNFQDVHKGQRIMDIYSPEIRMPLAQKLLVNFIKLTVKGYVQIGTGNPITWTIQPTDKSSYLEQAGIQHDSSYPNLLQVPELLKY